MPAQNPLTRRDALKTAAVSALGFPFLAASVARAAEAAAAPAPDAARPSPLRLGVASYSLGRMSADEVIGILQALRITNTGLYKTHCPWAGTVEECRAVGQKFKEAGITISGSGVISLPNDEAAVRKAFENAKAAGLVTMVCKPDVEALPLVEKFVKEHDLRLAIHNHGPEDKVYPTPFEAWKAIQPYDSRIGLCIDVGHAARAGADPVEAIRQCAARLYDFHLKDSVAVPGTMKDIPTEVGAGRLDIRGILAALIGIKYQGVVAFEYEKHGANPVIGLAESVGYVRGLLAGLSA